MGVYLSEPNTEKEIKEGKGSGVVYCKAEMQGICCSRQVGGSPWKMPLFMKLTLEMEIVSLGSLTDMEVPILELRT